MVAMISNVTDISGAHRWESRPPTWARRESGPWWASRRRFTEGAMCRLRPSWRPSPRRVAARFPPSPPSQTARTARAAHVVAAAHGGRAVSRAKSSDAKRGTDGWGIIRGSRVDAQGSGVMGDRISPILATARAGGFDGEQSIVDELRTAYVAAQDVLAPSDFTGWFRAKVLALAGIPMFTGCAYLPRSPLRVSSG